MTGLSEEDIRTRAYVLWKDAGEPFGKMDDFWYEAERQLLAKRSNGQVDADQTASSSGDGEASTTLRKDAAPRHRHKRTSPPEAGLRLRLLSVLVEVLRHFEVMLQSRQRLARPVLQLGIFTTVRVALEQRHRVLVRADLHRVVG